MNALKKFSPPMRQFVLWSIIAVVIIGGVSSLLGRKLIEERQTNTIAEVNARTALQAQGRAQTIQEFIEGVLLLGQHITDSDLVRLFVTEANAPASEDNAILSQKPYLNHALRELKEKYNLSEALILSQEGVPLAHAYTEPQEITLSPQQLLAHGTVLSSREPQVLPIRKLNNQLVLDIIKPILNMEETEKAETAGSLLISIPVTSKIKTLLAPAKLDRQGEHTVLLQRVGQSSLEAIQDNSLERIQMPEQKLVSLIETAKGREIHSPITEQDVFARLLPVFNTPFFILQEYKAQNALELVSIYKRALFGMIALASIALIALMLTLIGHLLAQRNRTRVRLLGQTMDALVRAVEIRDPYLSGHHMRTARLALKLGNLLGYSVDERATLFYAAQLSGIGKIFVPQEILTKKTKLTKAERKKLEAHVEYAQNVLKDVNFDLPILEVISHMYEREDGKGYPNGLKSKDIPNLSKLLATADAFTAMTHPRSYREALTPENAIKELSKSKQFDATTVKALKEVI